MLVRFFDIVMNTIGNQMLPHSLTLITALTRRLEFFLFAGLIDFVWWGTIIAYAAMAHVIIVYLLDINEWILFQDLTLRIILLK